MKRNIYFKSALLVSLVLSINISAFAQIGTYFAGSGAGTGNTGGYCTGVGVNALSSSNSGLFNTALGYQSLRYNTTGFYNTAFGYISLYSNTTGTNNTTMGAQSLRANTSGSYNTATGNGTLYANTTGNANSAFGLSALKLNTEGNYNNAFGYEALKNNINSWNNNAFGYNALSNNTTAWNNNAFGWKCLYSNTVGEENSAFGHDALFGNDSGSFNSAFGNYALINNTKGNYNSSLGTFSLNNNISGSNNVAVGYNAGALRNTYNKCTFIGATADASANNFTNAMALGYGAKVDASYKIRVGNTSITSIGGQVGWTTLSDLRLKENISDSKLGLDFILRLHPVTYNYKDEDQHGILYTGLIAQEVDVAAKKEGVDFSGVDKNGEYWGIRYGDLTVPLIKAVQETNMKLEEENSDLRNELTDMKNQIQQMREYLNTICANQQKINQSDLNSTPQLSIAPNPTNDVATITISSNDKLQKLVVKIIDASGKLIRSYNSETVSASYEFSTSSLSKGTYLLQLFNQNELMKTEKLIVQ